jgi:hypothetical protein
MSIQEEHEQTVSLVVFFRDSFCHDLLKAPPRWISFIFPVFVTV